MVLVDANIILRFLLNDNKDLFLKAKEIFLKAEKGDQKIYLDEVVIAEVVWTLSSFYKIKKNDIADRLEKIVSQDWAINPRKGVIMEALNLFKAKNLSFIDCWMAVVSKKQELTLETFDKNLKKII